jgi:hypothetical protein
MSKVSKTTNNRPVPIKKTKKVSIEKEAVLTPIKQIFLGDYLNVHTFQKHIITQSFIESEAKKLRDWADQEDSLLIQDFTDFQGYRMKLFYQWIKEHPVMEIAHEYAISRIGSRREKGAMTRKYAEASTHRTLGYYQEIWRDQTKELARMRDEVSAANETKVVVIDRFVLPEDAQLRLKTPEEVAREINDSTRDNRVVGPNQYKLRDKE